MDGRLLEILACPICKTDVKLEEGKVVCVKCGRRFPIENGIPIMLPKEATITRKENGEWLYTEKES